MLSPIYILYSLFNFQFEYERLEIQWRNALLGRQLYCHPFVNRAHLLQYNFRTNEIINFRTRTLGAYPKTLNLNLARRL